MSKKRIRFLGAMLLCLCVILVSGCKKKETEAAPTFDTVAYIGNNLYIEIPADWAHVMVESRPDLLVFAKKEGRAETGYNNVTVRMTRREAGEETTVTIDDMYAAFQSNFEKSTKILLPDANSFVYGEYDGDTAKVFTASFSCTVEGKPVTQTVLYPMETQGHIVFTAAKTDDTTPDPVAVAKHMIKTMRIGESDSA